MFHKDILNTSYRHKYQIKKVFEDILGLHGIDHFSLDLVRPDSIMLFFSSTPSHGYEICKRGYAPYDGIISPQYYKNYEFYWWENAYHTAYADKIIEIREKILGLKHGFMLVRRWNDFYLIYSFATKSKDTFFPSNLMNNINIYLEMGDHAYNEMRETYAEYTGPYEAPRVEKFHPFVGGPPPARYQSETITCTNNTTQPIKSNIIKVDFKKQVKLV